jgi:hypothetical protein
MKGATHDLPLNLLYKAAFLDQGKDFGIFDTTAVKQLTKSAINVSLTNDSTISLD